VGLVRPGIWVTCTYPAATASRTKWNDNIICRLCNLARVLLSTVDDRFVVAKHVSFITNGYPEVPESRT
jgi:hypothetical protein